MVIFFVVGVGICVGIIKGIFDGMLVGLKSVGLICYIGGGIIVKVVDFWIMCIVVIVLFYEFGVFIFVVNLLGISICIGGLDKFVFIFWIFSGFYVCLFYFFINVYFL